MSKKRKKNPNTTTHVVVLKLKVIPKDDKQKARLESIGRLCRRGRNAAFRNWLARQEGLPETAEQSAPGRPRKSNKSKTGKTQKPKQKEECTKLYSIVRDATPELDSQLWSALSGEVAIDLRTKQDWRDRVAGGVDTGRTCGEAMLDPDQEQGYPKYTKLNIPILYKLSDTIDKATGKKKVTHCRLVFGNRLFLVVRADRISKFRLRLSTKRLPATQLSHIKDIAEGRTKLPDSQLLERDGTWYLHIPVRYEKQLKPGASAELRPALCEGVETKDLVDKRPFVLSFQDDRPWTIGDGRYLFRNVVRLQEKRRAIGARYKDYRHGGGHGRKKYDDNISACYKQLSETVLQVRRKMALDTVTQCERRGCGTLIYFEPTGPAKEKCWFHRLGLDWDWDAFKSCLANVCARKRMRFVSAQYSIHDAMGLPPKPKSRKTTTRNRSERKKCH